MTSTQQNLESIPIGFSFEPSEFGNTFFRSSQNQFAIHPFQDALNLANFQILSTSLESFNDISIKMKDTHSDCF
jgi:hypothetical protein